MREILLPIDTSTPIKPHSKRQTKNSCSGSTLSIPVRKPGVAEGLTEKKLVETREGIAIFEGSIPLKNLSIPILPHPSDIVAISPLTHNVESRIV
jgi:hypothetical protein